MFVMPILFGIGCAAVLWVAARSQDIDARRLALALTALWALANLAWLLNAMWVLPILDWYLGVLALSLWWSRRAKWVALFVQIVIARLVLHVLDYLTMHAFLVPYIHALNATFTLLLVATASSGGRYGLDSMLSRVRRLRAVLQPAPSQRGLADA